jgi:hypothetical protein
MPTGRTQWVQVSDETANVVNAASHESVPGTFRTQRDVWLESVMRTKADIVASNTPTCSRK